MLLGAYLLLLSIAFERPAATTKTQSPAQTFLRGLIRSRHNEEGLTIESYAKREQDATNGCKFGKCPPDIIDHVLGNLTSNSVIKITHDSMLSSNIALANLTNVSLIGSNNPLITCHEGAGLQILFSHNVAIQGITWDQCGTEYLTPGIQFQFSSKIAIRNCSFQYSKGLALVLLNVSGDVNIHQCKFVNCNNSGGYGAAIHYSSSDPQLALMISDCEFSHNNGKSVLHVGESATYIIISNCVFYKNKGVPVYISSKGIKFDGYLLMEGNSAMNGGGIVIGSHTNIMFCKNSIAIFKNNVANKDGGAIYIDDSARVLFYETIKILFYNNRAANNGGAVYAMNNAYIVFEKNSDVNFTGNSALALGGAMHLQNTIVTFNNCTVLFDNNYSEGSGGAVFASRNCEITMKGNSTVTFRSNKAETGGAIRADVNCSLLHNESKVTFISNNATAGGAVIITAYSQILFGKSAVAVFINNTATEFYGTLWATENSNIICEADSNVTFSFNSAKINGGAVFLYSSSNILFTGSSVVTFNGNIVNDGGGAMQLSKYCDVTVKENSIVIFQDNKAENGGAMHLDTNSSFISKTYSIVKFTDNFATEGGAIDCDSDSTILLDENTVMNFSNNMASNGGAIAIKSNCDLTFKGSSEVQFISNRNIAANNGASTGFGGAVYTEAYSDINFLDNSNVMFSNNIAKFSGGAIKSYQNNIISVHDYSTLIFNNNKAKVGAGVGLGYNSTFNIDGYSDVTFSDNIAIGINTGYGGAIHIAYSVVDFKGNSNVLFRRNYVQVSGGAIYFLRSAVYFKGNSKVLFIRNTAADSGAAMSPGEDSHVQITENTIVMFSYNIAKVKGGALSVESNGDIIIIMGSSVVMFYSNEAKFGGAVYCTSNSNLTVDGNSTVRFLVNEAFSGGALHILTATVSFQGNSFVEFNGNSANVSGAVMAQANGEIVFKENCNVSFYNNTGAKWAGTIMVYDNSIAKHQGNSVIRFINNKAMVGGAIYCELNSNLTFDEESKVLITNNAAESGGAISLSNKCIASVKGYSILIFNANRASIAGGAIFSQKNCDIIFVAKSSITFSDNYATTYGGALEIYLNTYFTVKGKSHVMFNNNRAGSDGGAVQCDSNSSFMLTQNSVVSFQHNEAKYGSAVTMTSDSNAMFTGHATVLLNNNKAMFGGALFESDSTATVNGNSTITFNNNTASYGGSITIDKESDVNFKGSSVVKFTNNSAAFCGGAIFSQDKSVISFNETSSIVFNYNTAQFEGGAISSNSSSVLFEQSSTIQFNNNQAQIGESIFSTNFSNVNIVANLNVKFNNNTARWYVGPPYSNPSNDVTFDSNGIVTCSDPQVFPVCIQGQCFCKIIDYALECLTNNTSITITTDVVLSSVILLSRLQNISIVGQNNPTINCDGGGLHLVYCHNCTIDGINWNGCGNKSTNSPVLKIENCSSIKINKCIFKHSIGQVVVFLGILGDAKINHCKFVNNINYNGHGAALHYSSYSQHNLIINSCNFTNNVGAASIVYIEQLESLNYGISILNNSHFYDNHGIPVYLSNQNLCIMENSSFNENRAKYGAGIFATNHSTITFSNHSSTTFDHNTAVDSGAAIYITYYTRVLFEGDSQVSFNRNNATTGDGGAIYSYDNSEIIFKENSDIQFNCNLAKQGGALFFENNSDVIIDQNCFVTFDNNTADYGGALHLTHHSTIFLTGSSSIKFQNNTASKYGGAVHVLDTCSVVFMKNTTVTFYNNSAISSGGAIFFKTNSIVIFEETSTVIFDDNRAQDTGGAISSEVIPTDLSDETLELNFLVEFSNMTINNGNISSASLVFGGTIKATFMNNHAAQGGAIFSKLDVTFTANSTSIFTSNRADSGGAVYCESNTNIVFRANSMVKFINNTADQNGGALYYYDVTNVIFEESSSVIFNNNIADRNGGAICFSKLSGITFVNGSKSNVTFQNNKAANGGAICFEGKSSSTFGGSSTVLFTDNEATQGGAIFCENNSTLIFQRNSTTNFINNAGHEQAGAIFSNLNSGILFNDNSIVTYNNNKAENRGGSIYSEGNSAIVCGGNSVVTFTSNTVNNGEGGAVYSNINSGMIFKDDCQLTFAHNYAIQGGTVYSAYNSSLTFDGNTSVDFNSNTAISGGAINANIYCSIVFAGSPISIVKFDSNKAIQNGGAIQLETDSSVTVKGSMTVEFSNNEAVLGGAIYGYNATKVTIAESSITTFSKNNAKMGGAIFVTISNMYFTGNSSIILYDNKAWQDGGAIYLDSPFIITFGDHTKLTFSANTASDYGGAIYGKIADSKMIFHTTNFKFLDNNARTAGKSVFINVPTSCNSSCLRSSILGIDKEILQHSQLDKHITTSPSKLELYQPAICIDENMNKTGECNTYYVSDIMLGQTIIFDACMYDYYDQSSDAARFVVNGTADYQDYHIPGSNYMLISCNNTFEGVALIGNDTSPVLPFNYSTNITLYVDRISEMKVISVNFTVELVSCHPGFWYSDKSHKCECYNVSDIVYCTGRSSTIKRGYWFGRVTGKPTVTLCPINYCNFACCEASNGYYHLSPVRDNQCRLHRAGTACGSCEETYTLSFDSTECLPVETCTIGQSFLIIMLTFLYWAVIIVAIFIIMHFKVEIGYLYGITYYYSIIDILLSQTWYLSNDFNTAISIASSITKITPRFLGQLCFVIGMSGIDQQFIHYTHPVAISIFLVMITLLARRSRRLSYFISKGIIRIICCLLLLSYTSVATTSLLLMRPLIFHDVNKVYTYVSPDVEYLHGRHLAYVIVAVLFTIIIVIGLPLLLVLEPFLNSKINFIKIKPLLDQFQGCYKDKYRCFAGYYMICRLVIITIILADSSNNFIVRYSLITACIIMSLIHQISRPYSNNFLNVFDGVVLHLIVLVSVLPLVQFFDGFNSNLLVGLGFTLVALPSISYVAMTIVINKGNIKKLIKDCNLKWRYLCLRRRRYEAFPLDDDPETSPGNTDANGDNGRITTTVCDT